MLNNLHFQIAQTGNTAEVRVIAKGNTYPHKDTLKANGLKYQNPPMMDSWWESTFRGPTDDMVAKVSSLMQNIPAKKYTRS